MFTGMLGNATVSDLARAEHWYAQLIGRGPDRRPMPGLLEWQLGPGFGLQVYCEPERAGHSTVVLEVADLDAHAARLAEAGIEHPGIQASSPAGTEISCSFRILTATGSCSPLRKQGRRAEPAIGKSGLLGRPVERKRQQLADANAARSGLGLNDDSQLRIAIGHDLPAAPARAFDTATLVSHRNNRLRFQSPVGTSRS